MWVV
jgi:hypothetical protein